MLGSGAWEGIPAPFCHCTVCSAAAKNPKSKDNRTRPGLLVENGGRQFMVEASPDLRLQSARFGLKPQWDYVISHWHPDHMYGLRELHALAKESGKALNVYCSAGTAAVLRTNEYSYLQLDVTIVEALQPFRLAGVTITPLPVYHMRDQDDSIPEGRLSNAFGYLLEQGGKRAAFLADYYRVPKITMQKIRGIDAVICDGTYMLTDDYRAHKPNHMHGQEIFDFAASIGAKQTYYHSISHLTHQTHSQIQPQLPPNQFLTHDGQKIKYS